MRCASVSGIGYFSQGFFTISFILAAMEDDTDHQCT